jgi:hypothetical protein
MNTAQRRAIKNAVIASLWTFEKSGYTPEELAEEISHILALEQPFKEVNVRLRFAEEILDILSSGYFVSILNQHSDDLSGKVGEMVERYWRGNTKIKTVSKPTKTEVKIAGRFGKAETRLVCCSDMAMAFCSGTDNEGYGAIAHCFGGSSNAIQIGCDLPPLRLCPWCGFELARLNWTQ